MMEALLHREENDPIRTISKGNKCASYNLWSLAKKKNWGKRKLFPVYVQPNQKLHCNMSAWRKSKANSATFTSYYNKKQVQPTKTHNQLNRKKQVVKPFFVWKKGQKDNVHFVCSLFSQRISVFPYLAEIQIHLKHIGKRQWWPENGFQAILAVRKVHFFSLNLFFSKQKFFTSLHKCFLSIVLSKNDVPYSFDLTSGPFFPTFLS